MKNDYSASIIQCPIDTTLKSISNKTVLLQTLGSLKNLGMQRLSIDWNTPNLKKLLDQVDRLGFDVNIYNLPDLESFLKAVLLMPGSITADFNFPKWHYFGRGSGEGLKHHLYLLKQISQTV